MINLNGVWMCLKLQIYIDSAKGFKLKNKEDLPLPVSYGNHKHGEINFYVCKL